MVSNVILPLGVIGIMTAIAGMAIASQLRTIEGKGVVRPASVQGVSPRK
jgi:hypothetical protein